ncbi:cytochrome c maturation protein CcmE [Xanthomonas campestris pv. badrii]|uniref:Cytochrome c-type biogenesis protein CcmE n=1 Tax=Xanthomonas campestris pv. badrii TaxID=149696 RepID=A0A7Z2ZHE8_XANCA|nr:cytochrome c maturation protein CcmE [Xanthomonas campestris]MCC4604310.1 cytochrome c maturation protein CcmE [Xanthomonas campestris pv. parthenii]QJD67440.1 cytochrome c maturation protein CcmE [Xanthomonas campestris pv. badrii]
MNATRKHRLWLVVGVLAAAALAGTLIVLALQRNMSYLFTPSQVHAGEASGYRQFRLGGMVKAGSIQRASDSLKVSFTVIDKHAATQVEYTGILPDLFRDNQSVIANGRMQGARFVATEVLAKHDETYMPKELKDAMAEGHLGKPIPATAAPLTTPR